MPWNPQDSNRHKKGLSPSSQVKWSKIANSVLAKTGDEASAVRIANSRTSAVKRRLDKKITEKRGY